MRFLVTAGSFVVGTAVALLLVVLPATASRAETRGPVVLTVIGELGETNRPAFDAFADSFFAYHEITFEKAYAFDRSALLALPQVSLVANASNWPAPVSASGPRLADVLAAAGVAAEAKITLVALDGYAAELDGAARTAEDWVLALEADGSALGVGDRGPLWLLFDTGGTAEADDGTNKWVYSVFTIKVD